LFYRIPLFYDFVKDAFGRSALSHSNIERPDLAQHKSLFKYFPMPLPPDILLEDSFFTRRELSKSKEDFHG
jgi:hypothetical protein